MQESPASVTVKVWPPIATVPVRAAPGFAATLTVTELVPEPLVGLTPIQLAPLAAVQPHAVALDARTAVPAPPVAATDSVLGDRAKLHETPA